MVGRIGELLRLQRDRLTEAQRLAILAVVRTIEEVAAVELKSYLIRRHIHAAARRGIVERSHCLYLTVILTRENPVHVVAVAELELVVISIDTLADDVRLTEIVRRTLDGAKLTGRNQTLVRRRDVVTLDRQHVVQNRTAALTLEVEERVVRQVHNRRGIRLRTIVDAELVRRSQRVGHHNVQVPRETLLTVGRTVTEDNRRVGGRLHVPNHAVEALQTAVQRLAVVVLRKRVLLAVEREAPLGYAVGVTTQSRTQKTFPFVVQITVDRLVAQDHILRHAVPVRSPERHDTSPEVRDLHRQIPVPKRVERNRFPLHRRGEGLRIEEAHRRFRLAAARCKEQRCGRNSHDFHIKSSFKCYSFYVITDRPCIVLFM